jgi:Asp-tRNA(Asn)/Glu-tRNA(Gln) amidotransferase B subunit
LTTGDEKERRKKSGFFVGEVMKATRGQADGRIVNELLARRAVEQGG